MIVSNGLVLRVSSKMSDNYSCNFCPHSTTLKPTLKTHKTLKHNECQECGETKSSMLSLLNHQKSIHPNYKGAWKVERCTKCELVTIGKTLKKHYYVVHGMMKTAKILFSSNSTNNASNLLCTFCEYSTNVTTSLNTHLTLKHNKCQMCNFIDSSLMSLWKHQDSLHRDYKGLFKLKKCSKCEFISVSKNLKRHQERKHPEGAEGEKRYSCKRCDYATDEKYSYDIHLQVKPKEVLICKTCNFKSCSSTFMGKHMKTMHGGGIDGRFSCKRCDVTFERYRDFSRHLPYSIPSKLAQCEECAFKSCTHQGLRSHKMMIHKKSQISDEPTKTKEKISSKQPLSKEKPKTYNYFPQPKEGKWIVKLERIAWK